jgi:AcrR family transcriptional regulator
MKANTIDPSIAGARPVRRSQAERRGVSDRRMLRAAIKLVARRGLSGTNLADIGLLAGYSRGLPLFRYGSKLGLFEALLQSMDSWFDQRLETALRDKQGLAALRARMAAHLGGMRSSPLATSALYSIFIESLFGMPELKPQIAVLTGRWRHGLAADLREGQVRGEIRPDIDCDQQATIILCALRGLMIDHMMDPKTTDLHTIELALSRIVDEMACVTPSV